MDSFTFTLIGGEQSDYDHIAFVGAETELYNKIYTGYLVNEDDYLSIILSRNSDRSYTLNYTNM